MCANGVLLKDWWLETFECVSRLNHGTSLKRTEDTKEANPWFYFCRLAYKQLYLIKLYLSYLPYNCGLYKGVNDKGVYDGGKYYSSSSGGLCFELDHIPPDAGCKYVFC